MTYVEIGGKRIEVLRLAAAHPRNEAPAIVFLHEGLGSAAMWRDFPQEVADATGCESIVYSRIGYGGSDPITERRSVRYMHDEALVTLPKLLDALAVRAPILLGHSDGASIALIYAGGAERRLAGLILMAPHVIVEDLSVASIAQAKLAYETTGLRERLARYHADVDSAFRGWNDIWLDPAFRAWSIESYLPAIRCPILAIQGEDDEYGTMDQVERIVRQCRDVDLVRLAGCGHSPQRDQPGLVIGSIARFVSRLRP